MLYPEGTRRTERKILEVSVRQCKVVKTLHASEEECVQAGAGGCTAGLVPHACLCTIWEAQEGYRKLMTVSSVRKTTRQKRVPAGLASAHKGLRQHSTRYVQTHCIRTPPHELISHRAGVLTRRASRFPREARIRPDLPVPLAKAWIQVHGRQRRRQGREKRARAVFGRPALVPRPGEGGLPVPRPREAVRIWPASLALSLPITMATCLENLPY